MLGLQQMFEVMAARFNAVTQTFAPLIDSVVDGISAADRTTRQSDVASDRAHRE